MTTTSFIIKNMFEFKKALNAEDKRRVKAGETAVKVEGFRLMKILKAQIKAGLPGGRPLSPLSEIAKKKTRGRNKKPLAKLATPIRYAAKKIGKNLVVSVGFIDPGKGRPISKSWKKIAKFLQEGGRVDIGKLQRPIMKYRPTGENLKTGLIKMGIRLKKRKNTKAKYFFVKGRSINVPKRPIIEPFWKAHTNEAERNVILNFERKMRGERI